MKQELLNRLDEVTNNIKQAAEKSGRNPDEIKLIAVSKNHEKEKIKFFHEQGIEIFGESRVQELMKKDESITEFDVRWHFIGHLQRNKVKYLMRMHNCEMIESLDSWRLAKKINKRAGKNNRIMPVLIEVNVSGDDSKYGIDPGETVEFVKKASKFNNLDIQGLMTLAPYLDDPEEARPYFRLLADLREDVNSQGFNLKELSMGMTNDYQIAIEEGATIVRIGTALFGKRNY